MSKRRRRTIWRWRHGREEFFFFFKPEIVKNLNIIFFFLVAKCNKKSSGKNKTRTIIIFRDKMIFSKDDNNSSQPTVRDTHTPKGKQKKLYTFFRPDKWRHLLFFNNINYWKNFISFFFVFSYFGCKVKGRYYRIFSFFFLFHAGNGEGGTDLHTESVWKGAGDFLFFLFVCNNFFFLFLFFGWEFICDPL
jgi:hypothetical protein